MLAEVATNISKSCQMGSPLGIATFDTRDFTKMLGDGTLKLRVYDMNSLEWLELV